MLAGLCCNAKPSFRRVPCKGKLCPRGRHCHRVMLCWWSGTAVPDRHSLGVLHPALLLEQLHQLVLFPSLRLNPTTAADTAAKQRPSIHERPDMIPAAPENRVVAPTVAQ